MIANPNLRRIPLYDFRKAKGWTLRQLEARSGIPANAICNYERGYVEPLVGSALKLAQALGVSIEELFFKKPGEKCGT